MWLPGNDLANTNALSFIFQDSSGVLAAAGGGGEEGRGWEGRGEAQLLVPFEGDTLNLRCLPGNGSGVGCPFCGFISRGINTRQNLHNHLLTHTGEKPFQCSECPMRFLKKSNLKRHMLRHHHSHGAIPAEATSNIPFDHSIH